MRPIWDSLRRKVESAASELPSDVIGPFVNDEFGDVFGTIVAITGDGFQLCRARGDRRRRPRRAAAHPGGGQGRHLRRPGGADLCRVQQRPPDRARAVPDPARTNPRAATSSFRAAVSRHARRRSRWSRRATSRRGGCQAGPDLGARTRRTHRASGHCGDRTRLHRPARRPSSGSTVNRPSLSPSRCGRAATSSISAARSERPSTGSSASTRSASISTFVQFQADPVDQEGQQVHRNSDAGHRRRRHRDAAQPRYPDRSGRGEPDPNGHRDGADDHGFPRYRSQPDVAGITDDRARDVGGQRHRHVRIDHGTDG